MRHADDDDDLLTPAEAAAEMRVTPRTMALWAAAGKLTEIKTPGGTRRYRRGEVKALRKGKRADGVQD